MLICGQEFDDEILERISAAVVEDGPGLSRRALSMRVCEWLNWRSPNGKPKDMTCRTALLKLNRQGIIPLPEPVGPNLFGFKRRYEERNIFKGIDKIACTLEQLGQVELIPIEAGDRETSRIWNGLMERYHYLGSGPLCGAQMRYLIRSACYGWIGGLSFSAAAWQVKARDVWIGWSKETRMRNLSKVLCNSRFLLVPKVPNLASHILSRCLKRIQDDWNVRYGIEPVLIETYVEKERFEGTCYQAANWLHIGSTQGRGRTDRFHIRRVPVKEIYVCPLTRYAREILCVAGNGDVLPIRPVPMREKEQVPKDWAEEEVGAAGLSDHRLTKRLVTLLQDRYARPQASIPQACQSRAKTKAAYRFFAHPETTMEKILAPHYQTTVSRITGEPLVLAVQDTTSLNYTAHPATKDLGPIGNLPDDPIGLLVHDTMAFNVEGTPLGLLDVQCWARDPEQFGKKKLRYQLPIEQKESYKWLRSFQRVAEAQKRCPNTMVVSVGDREADIYELIEMALGDPSGPKLLVRAAQNRILAQEQGHLWSRVSSQEISAYLDIRVPRRGNKPARQTTLAVRCAQVMLKPPRHKSERPLLAVWAILARELDETAMGTPIEWLLLTTCDVATSEQAVEKIRWYTRRWGIEVYHRTLKSGCKIEERQLGTADRIEACLAIDMIVAWRVFHLAKLGRETPDVPCTVFFEDHEWQALLVYWTRKLPAFDTPPTLREAMRLTAQLGGFLGRKCDGDPGTKSLWIGLQRLDDLAAMYQFMLPLVVPHPHNTPVSSNPGYG
jgi:hypothetical protein